MCSMPIKSRKIPATERYFHCPGHTGGRLTEEEGQELYQALAKTLDRIGQEETAYRKALNEFDDSETNLSYVFIENEQVIYTNMLEDTEEDITSYVFGDKAHNL